MEKVNVIIILVLKTLSLIIIRLHHILISAKNGMFKALNKTKA